MVTFLFFFFLSIYLETILPMSVAIVCLGHRTSPLMMSVFGCVISHANKPSPVVSIFICFSSAHDFVPVWSVRISQLKTWRERNWYLIFIYLNTTISISIFLNIMEKSVNDVSCFTRGASFQGVRLGYTSRFCKLMRYYKILSDD